MRSPVTRRFAAVFQTEVLFNLKRVAPYAMMVLFSANALLWWGWGPAVTRGWAVNSDFYILRLCSGFTFLTLPLFIALIMGDPVIRDFRTGIDPLIFSKPVSRAEYLLGKFFGNFFVLVCCQACFALTLLLLQGFDTPGMIVLSPRVLPYFQHFFFFVVISSFAFGVVYFTVGTLTRNVKIVYGLAVSFYFLYIAWQMAIKSLSLRWRITLDPLLFNIGAEFHKGRTAEWLNQLTISYDSYMIANRLLLLVVSGLCLTILYFRFSVSERVRTSRELSQTTLLNLAPAFERLSVEPASSRPEPSASTASNVEASAAKATALPQVTLVHEGVRAHLEQFRAALGVEFRLLRAERSLVAIAPLIIFMCGLELGAFEVVPDVSYSAAYAGRTATTLLLFLFAIAVFYTGESMHRDRETGIEPVLWSTPASNFVLLISKFAATLWLSLALLVLVALTAIVIQIYRGDAPLELWWYLKTHALISLPSAVFMIAAAVVLNVLLRDKYLTYAVALALGGTLYYLTGQGYHNWLYNPVLYQLWTPADLVSGESALARLLLHRIYCLALSALLLACALLVYERKSADARKSPARFGQGGWTLVVAGLSLLLAVITGYFVNGRW